MNTPIFSRPAFTFLLCGLLIGLVACHKNNENTPKYASTFTDTLGISGTYNGMLAHYYWNQAASGRDSQWNYKLQLNLINSSRLVLKIDSLSTDTLLRRPTGSSYTVQGESADFYYASSANEYEAYYFKANDSLYLHYFMVPYNASDDHLFFGKK